MNDRNNYIGYTQIKNSNFDHFCWMKDKKSQRSDQFFLEGQNTYTHTSNWSGKKNIQLVNAKERKVKIISNNRSNRNMNTLFILWTFFFTNLPLSRRQRFGFISFYYDGVFLPFHSIFLSFLFVVSLLLLLLLCRFNECTTPHYTPYSLSHNTHSHSYSFIVDCLI